MKIAVIYIIELTLTKSLLKFDVLTKTVIRCIKPKTFELKPSRSESKMKIKTKYNGEKNYYCEAVHASHSAS